MSSESVTVLCTVGGLFLGIVGHALATVWWASQITSTLRFQSEELKRIGKQLAEHSSGFYPKDEAKEQFDKRDIEMRDIYEKIGAIISRVSVIEAKSTR